MYAQELICEVDGVRALDGVSLELSGDARALSFLGEADSGAAELALLLAGILPRMLLAETTGTFSGFSTRKRDEAPEAREASVGYVAPDPADQIVGLSVQAELEWAWSRSRLDQASMPADLKTFLEQLDLDHLMERSTGKLSSGQRQRVAIASIAIADPDLLVLDNCFSSLDRLSVSALIHHIEWRVERGLATWVIGRPHLKAASQTEEYIELSAGRLLSIGNAAGKPHLERSLDATIKRRQTLYSGLGAAIERHCSLSSLQEISDFDFSTLYLPSETGERPRLDIDHFGADPGEVIGIRGDNGSGKSSLLSALAGLERLPKRKIRWGQTDSPDRRLCYLSPDGIPAWIARLDHHEIWPMAPADAELKLLLDQLLQEDRYAPIADGAYRSRENPWRRLWWIAASVHADIGWLLLDEPTTGMDEQQEECLRRLLLAHAGRGGGALVVSHDHDFLEATSRRLITIGEGRIQHDSRASDGTAVWSQRLRKVSE